MSTPSIPLRRVRIPRSTLEAMRSWLAGLSVIKLATKLQEEPGAVRPELMAAAGGGESEPCSLDGTARPGDVHPGFGVRIAGLRHWTHGDSTVGIGSDDMLV